MSHTPPVDSKGAGNDGFLSEKWWADDIDQYNLAVRGLPTITSSNASPEVIQHIAFLGEEVVRLREMVRELSKPPPERQTNE